MEFADLSDDCLLAVLERLPFEELMKVQRVNKRLKRMAGIKMNVKIEVLSLRSEDIREDCTHLGKINRESLLYLKWPVEKELEGLLIKESSKELIFKALSKCAGVKSIDFFNFNLPDGFLLEVVSRCPELMCIHLGAFENVKEDEWSQVFDLMGQRMVHFSRDNHYKISAQSEIRLIEQLATNCPNLRRVDWSIGPILEWPVTSDFMSAFKLLPKRCWISFDSFNLFEVDTIDDVVDSLYVSCLKWNLLKDRYDRLSKLRLEGSSGNRPVTGVTFAGLKTLNYCVMRRDDEKGIKSLIASRYPQLEEFWFQANARLTGYEYQALFEKMETVKKLNIRWLFRSIEQDPMPKLPRLSMLQLKNLETLELEIMKLGNIPSRIPSNVNPEVRQWQTDEFVKLVEFYVDEISTLKKLTVELDGFDEEINKKTEDEIIRIKQKQNRVKVNLKITRD